MQSFYGLVLPLLIVGVVSKELRKFLSFERAFLIFNWNYLFFYLFLQNNFNWADYQKKLLLLNTADFLAKKKIFQKKKTEKIVLT